MKYLCLVVLVAVFMALPVQAQVATAVANTTASVVASNSCGCETDIPPPFNDTWGGDPDDIMIVTFWDDESGHWFTYWLYYWKFVSDCTNCGLEGCPSYCDNPIVQF